MKKFMIALISLLVMGIVGTATPASAATTYWKYSTCRWSNGVQDSVGVKYESIGGGVVRPIQVSHNGQPVITYARWDWILGGVIRDEWNFADNVPNQVHNVSGGDYGTGGRTTVRLSATIGNCYGTIYP